jgi:AraC-like DNA-binding protein
VKNLSPPRELINVIHYHQTAGIHPQPRMIPRHHECVELVTAGRGWVRQGDDWIEVTAGDLIWNSPGDQTIGRSEFGDPYRCLAVVLRVATPQGRQIPRFSAWPDVAAAKKFTREVTDLFLDDSFDRTFLMNYIDAVLYMQVCQHAVARRVQRYTPPVRTALDIMESRFSHPLLVEAVARLAGVSSPHLHELFRHQVGATPHQWLIQRRIREARERLVRTTDSVKETAHACGFSDASSFTHAFRKSTGLTPSAFRAHYFPS